MCALPINQNTVQNWIATVISTLLDGDEQDTTDSAGLLFTESSDAQPNLGWVDTTVYQ